MINLPVWAGIIVILGFVGLCTGSMVWIYKHDNKKKQENRK
jgi:hypothetical protein